MGTQIQSEVFWGRLVGVVLVGVALSACTGEKGGGPNGDGPDADSSSLAFEIFEFSAFHEDGIHDAGLSFNWTLEFTSSTGRDCRLRRYELYAESGNASYIDDDPGPWLIRNGNTVSGKVVWVPVDAQTSAGNYSFIVEYETGQMVEQPGGGEEWVGPYSDSTTTIDFSVPDPS